MGHGRIGHVRQIRVRPVGRRELLIGKEVANLRDLASDGDCHFRGGRQIVLHDEGPVVIAEEGDLCRGDFDTDRLGRAQSSTDAREDIRGKGVKVGGVIRDGQDIEFSVGIIAGEDDGVGRAAGGNAQHVAPRVVGEDVEVFDFGDEDIARGFGKAGPPPAEQRAGTAGEGEAADRHRGARGFGFADIFDAFTFHGTEEAGSDADRFAGFELGLNLANDVGIELGLLGEKDHAGVGRELREDVHGQANHAQVVVEELLAGGVIGRVGFDADRFAELGQNLVNLAQRVGGDVGERGIAVIRAEGLLDFGEIETGGLVGPRAVGDGIRPDGPQHAASS